MRLEYLVEKNTHLRRFEGTGGVLKYGADLRKRHARKPVHEVRDVGAGERPDHAFDGSLDEA